MFLPTLLSLALLAAVGNAHNPSPHQNPRPHHPPPGPSNHNHQWHTINSPLINPTGPNSFTLTTPPATDLWRPNVTADNFTAPYLYTTCSSSSFKSISVTVSADLKTRYDQGGIAIFFPNKDHHGGRKNGDSEKSKPLKWLKTGIEFENSAPQFGTVGTYAFSDWSLSPIVPSNTNTGKFIIERSTTELWVYAVLEGGERYPLREVTWAFLEERGEEGADIWVGVYAAKPTYVDGRPDEGLVVEFQDLEVDC